VTEVNKPGDEALEDFRQCWEMIRALYQDRRHTWTYLVGILAGVPAVIVGLVGSGEAGILLQLAKPSAGCPWCILIGAVLLLLAVVGFLGFMTLLHNRRTRVRYTRELNAFRKWWKERNCCIRTSEFLHACPTKPPFWKLGDDAWLTLTIALITAVLLGSAVWLLTPGLAKIIVNDKWVAPLVASVVAGIIMYAVGRCVLREETPRGVKETGGKACRPSERAGS